MDGNNIVILLVVYPILLYVIFITVFIFKRDSEKLKNLNKIVDEQKSIIDNMDVLIDNNLKTRMFNLELIRIEQDIKMQKLRFIENINIDNVNKTVNDLVDFLVNNYIDKKYRTDPKFLLTSYPYINSLLITNEIRMADIKEIFLKFKVIINSEYFSELLSVAFNIQAEILPEFIIGKYIAPNYNSIIDDMNNAIKINKPHSISVDIQQDILNEETYSTSNEAKGLQQLSEIYATLNDNNTIYTNVEVNTNNNESSILDDLIS